MDYDKIYTRVKETLSPKRFKHSTGVVNYAEMLAKIFNCSVEKAKLAAIAHDYAKEIPKERLLSMAKEYNIYIDDITLEEPKLLHGPVGAVLAKRDLGIEDDEILDAIAFHTTGRAKMTTLDKIIYLADVIEENRTPYPGLENIRNTAKTDLNKAMLMAVDNSIHYLVSIKALLHPKTIEARNDLLLEQKRKNLNL